MGATHKKSLQKRPLKQRRPLTVLEVLTLDDVGKGSPCPYDLYAALFFLTQFYLTLCSKTQRTAQKRTTYLCMTAVNGISRFDWADALESERQQQGSVTAECDLVMHHPGWSLSAPAPTVLHQGLMFQIFPLMKSCEQCVVFNGGQIGTLYCLIYMSVANSATERFDRIIEDINPLFTKSVNAFLGFGLFQLCHLHYRFLSVQQRCIIPTLC